MGGRLLLVLVLLFISTIALAPEKAYGNRNIDLVIRRSAEEKPTSMKGNGVVGFDVKKESEAPSPSSSDLSQTSKRRVRRGSDPIHNRC